MSEVIVKEKPILFSGPMVKAIIEGRKTMTRRLPKWKFNPEYPGVTAASIDRVEIRDGIAYAWGETWRGDGIVIAEAPVPYEPGMRLWVRETFAECAKAGGHIIYKADCEGIGTCHVSGGQWKPSIFMPRWASRITLEVTEVRVERLQDISEADAMAEGVSWQDYKKHGSEPAYTDYLYAFRVAWDQINGTRASRDWESNPWVWVVAFKVVENNNNHNK